MYVYIIYMKTLVTRTDITLYVLLYVKYNYNTNGHFQVSNGTHNDHASRLHTSADIIVIFICRLPKTRHCKMLKEQITINMKEMVYVLKKNAT